MNTGWNIVARNALLRSEESIGKELQEAVVSLVATRVERTFYVAACLERSLADAGGKDRVGDAYAVLLPAVQNAIESLRKITKDIGTEAIHVRGLGPREEETSCER